MGPALRTLLAVVAIAAVWWSMADLILSSGAIEAGVRVGTTSPMHDGLNIVTSHDFSDCCYEFNTTLALSFWLTAFSALPLAIIAMGLTWRRELLPASETLQAVLRAALILQGASAAANLFLAYVVLSFAESFLRDFYLWAFTLLGGAVVSAMAVPPWYRLTRVVAPELKVVLKPSAPSVALVIQGERE